ncbi:hypothetical protein B0A53_01263 [Rhodotorula sp. CCFEE 5036]|nr:hypothetical protein B0A53_01263 [Rhodotorula sp. CCFEE 5036]
MKQPLLSMSKSEDRRQAEQTGMALIEQWRIEVAQELERGKTKRLSIGESVAQAVQDVSELFLGSPFLRSFKVASLVFPTADIQRQLASPTTGSWSYPTTPTTAVSSAVVQTAHRATLQHGLIIPRTVAENLPSATLTPSSPEPETSPSSAFQLAGASIGNSRPPHDKPEPPHSGSPPFSNLAQGQGLPSGYILADIPAKAAAILGLDDACLNYAAYPPSRPRKPLLPINAPVSSFSHPSNGGPPRDSSEMTRAPFAKRNPPPAPLRLPTPRSGHAGDGGLPKYNGRELNRVESALGAGTAAGRSCADQMASGAIAQSGKRGADAIPSRERKPSLAKLSVGKLTRSLSGRRGRAAAPGMKS